MADCSTQRLSCWFWQKSQQLTKTPIKLSTQQLLCVADRNSRLGNSFQNCQHCQDWERGISEATLIRRCCCFHFLCKQSCLLSHCSERAASTLGQKCSNYPKNHIFEISLSTKFTFSKCYSSEKSHFQGPIFHKIHIFRVPFFTKFTFSESLVGRWGNFWIIVRFPHF